MNTAALVALSISLSGSAFANGPVASAPPSRAPKLAVLPAAPAPAPRLPAFLAAAQRLKTAPEALEALLAAKSLDAERFLALPEAEQAKLAAEAAAPAEPVVVGQEAPAVEAADPAKLPGSAAKVAEALLGVLEDTQNADDRPAVLKRIDGLLWKNYADDALGHAVVSGLAAQMTEDSDADELRTMAATVEGAARRGDSVKTRSEGLAALAKAASLMAAEDEDEGIKLLETLESVALESDDHEVRRAAIGVLRAQRADFDDDDSSYRQMLDHVIANLKDSFQDAAAVKNDPGVAVTLALTQSLAKAGDEDDGARIVDRLMAAARTYPYEAAQRAALRGLLRALRDAQSSSFASKTLEGIEQLAGAGSEHVKGTAVSALKRLARDDDFSYAGKAGKSLARIQAKPAAAEGVPSPEPEGDGTRSASGRTVLLAAGVAVSLAALLWLFGGF